MTDSRVTREAVEGRKSEWPGINKLARKIAELYAPSGVPKDYRETDVAFKAAEWVCPILERELGPLLEKAEIASRGFTAGSPKDNLRMELEKWIK